MKKLLGLLLLLGACTNEPTYIGSDPMGNEQLEVGTGAAGDMGTATKTLDLPYDGDKLNGMDYAKTRDDLLASINAGFDPDITLDQLPFVRLDQVDISIEWSVKNLDDEAGQAFIDINGGNQYFYYVPLDFAVINPANPEDTQMPPPLAGHTPIDVPAHGEMNGVFREDTMREAALDLDLITRGTINPYAAILNNNEDITSTADVPYVTYPPPMEGDPQPTPPPPFPIDAFANFVRFDVTFQPDHHMVLEYAVRVRDPDGLLHDKLLAADPAQLMPFMPAEYVPPAPPA